MSNLGQLATIVGQRLGVDTSIGTSRDGAAVRAFLSMRHDQLYRAYLWKDSVIEMAVNPQTPYVPTSNYMPTKGRVILPPIFQHVLGARMGCYSLDVQRPMFFYRANYARFFNSGWAADFVLMSSCVWEFDAVQNLALQATNAADTGQTVTLDELASDEVSVNRTTWPLSITASPCGSTDRIDNFIKPQTQGAVNLGIATGYTVIESVITAVRTSLTPFSVYYSLTAQDFTFAIGQTVLIQAGGGLQCTALINDLVFVNLKGYGISITPLQAAGDSPIGTVFPIGSTISLAAMSTVLSLQANDLSALKSQRLQLVGKPTTPQQLNTNIHILGKRNTPPFIAESDVVGVNGFEGILIALAYYDFKQRDESGGTPDAITALTEAVGPTFLTTGKPGGFLGKLVEEETIQEAYNTRIIPDHGFGGCGYYDEPWDKAFPYSSGGW